MELPTRPRTTKPSGQQPRHAPSTAFVRNVAQAGGYCDGDGLYLDVQPTGRAAGYSGPSSAPGTANSDAAASRLCRSRTPEPTAGSPAPEAIHAEKRRLTSMPTFATATGAVLFGPTQMRPGWRNPKHDKDRIGKLPVSEVTSADVVETLRKV